jgi:GTPase SAR1 family protein
MCSRETFLALQTWLADCRALASPDIVIILVGNKSDISTPATNNLNGDVRSFENDFRGGEVAGGFHREREVSVEEAGRWASREGFLSPTLFLTAILMVGIGFLEASALDGTNVDEAFLRCARQILTKVELGTPH